MGLNELLPIRFDFRLAPARWTALEASSGKYGSNHYDGEPYEGVATSLLYRQNRAGGPIRMSIPLEHLPPDRRERIQNGDFRGVPASKLSVLECQPSDGQESKRVDPRRLRDEFFNLEEEPDGLMRFLNRYGAWVDDFRFGGWTERRIPPRPIAKPLVPVGYFWHYRTLLARRLEAAGRRPESWFDSTTEPLALLRIPKYPYHSHRVAYIKDAIEMSFTIDFLKQTPISLCAREDCRKPYVVTRPGKTFCSEKCARCVVMRRARALNRTIRSRG
jgi:hypothetical protein